MYSRIIPSVDKDMGVFNDTRINMCGKHYILHYNQLVCLFIVSSPAAMGGDTVSATEIDKERLSISDG